MIFTLSSSVQLHSLEIKTTGQLLTSLVRSKRFQTCATSTSLFPGTISLLVRLNCWTAEHWLCLEEEKRKFSLSLQMSWLKKQRSIWLSSVELETVLRYKSLTRRSTLTNYVDKSKRSLRRQTIQKILSDFLLIRRTWKRTGSRTASTRWTSKIKFSALKTATSIVSQQ